MTKSEQQGIDILVVAPIYGPTMAALEQEYVVHRLWEAPDKKALLDCVKEKVRGLVTTGLVGFDNELIDALPRLEIVACFGVAHGTLATNAARAHGVAVTNTPDASAESVAEIAIGLILSVMHRICECDRFVRSGGWLRNSFSLGTTLSGKTCGIIGMGRIGRALAKRAEALGMNPRYQGPRQKSDVAYPYHADVQALARISDCLVVTCPAIPETQNLVDESVLEALGSNGYLINVARGSIVNESALIAALRDRRIAGAGLDVFVDEPRVPEELCAMENVVLLAHIGTSTKEIREARSALLLANLRAYFSGKPVLSPVV